MKNRIFFFPRINIEQKTKFNSKNLINISYYYEMSNKHYDLRLENIDGYSENYFRLVDENNNWYVEEHSIGIKGNIILNEFSYLFGSDGIAVSNSKIGIAVIYYSGDSKHRGSIKIGEFEKNDSKKNISFEKQFEIGEFRGIVKFEIILYIAKSGIPKLNETHMANVEGYRLGILKEFNIVLDGIGSWFPIYEKYLPGAPLWKLRCDLDNPDENLFTENIELIINKSHSEYKNLDISKSTFNRQMMIEILSEVLSLIIIKLRVREYDWNNIISDDFNEGSISQAVKYFLTMSGCDSYELENLSYSIRKYLEENLKF